MNIKTKNLLKEFSNKLYLIKDNFYKIDTSVVDYISDLSYYTIEEDDEDLDDGYQVGDILYCQLFGDFALYIRERLSNENMNDKLLLSSVQLMQDMYNTNNYEIINLVETCILEVLADSEKCKLKLKAIFNSSLLDAYNSVISNYNIKIE